MLGSIVIVNWGLPVKSVSVGVYTSVCAFSPQNNLRFPQKWGEEVIKVKMAAIIIQSMLCIFDMYHCIYKKQHGFNHIVVVATLALLTHTPPLDNPARNPASLASLRMVETYTKIPEGKIVRQMPN